MNIQEIIKTALSKPTLKEALVYVATWDTEQAIRTAIRTHATDEVVNVDTGAKWETFSNYLFEKVLEGWKEQESESTLSWSAISLARHTAWTAFTWNDHNFQHDPKHYAQECCKHFNINTLEEANVWLESLLPGGDALMPLPTPIVLNKSGTALVTRKEITDIFIKHSGSSIDPDIVELKSNVYDAVAEIITLAKTRYITEQ